MKKRLFAILLLMILTAPLGAQDMILDAPDGTEVTIQRDEFGVPHIFGESETGVFFGQGWAAAQDRLVQMLNNYYLSMGRVSEILGDSYLDWDRNIRTLYYTDNERQQHFNNLTPELQNALEAYAAGVNHYFLMMEAEPAVYMPAEIYLMQAMGFQLEPWTPLHSIGVMQFYIRQFGQFGGDELDRLQELQAYGWDWFDDNRPINDPDAPTTIPHDEAFGGLPAQDWHYSRKYVSPDVIQNLIAQKESIAETADQLGVPPTFGSFAVQISQQKSATGNVMLLGCPQMGAPSLNETNVVHEVELMCPEFHVGGMNIAGLPAVIIGHTEEFAWTLTSGISDNTDTYIDSTMDQTMSQYYHDGEWLEFDEYSEIIVSQGVPHEFTHYRTIHGPVIGDDLSNQMVFSHKMTFWQEEHLMLKWLYDLIKSDNLQEFESAAEQANVSFNLFYAGTGQNIKFWHVGKYQDRSDGVDPRLPHLGYGSEEWGGFIPFEDLPQLANPLQTYFVNWNNKPVIWWNNGDNVPYGASDIGSQYLTNRVNSIYEYIGPIDQVSYMNLKAVPFNISDHGTYQHAVEFAPGEIIDSNIVPPGQSAFTSIDGTSSPHMTDQWDLHLAWDFKDQQFYSDVQIVPGDVNFDAEIDVLDIVMIVNVIMGLEELTPNEFTAADLNEDDVVNVQDIIMIVNLIMQ